MTFIPEYISWQGYSVLYGSQATYSRNQALTFLQAAGMSLHIPGSASKILVLEGLGERRLDVSEAEFQRRIEDESSLFFKVWSPNQADLLCSLRRDAGWWAEHYFIGYLQHESKNLVMKILERFVREVGDGNSELLVVDWEARAEDFDWDEFWRGSVDYAGEPTEIMGIPDRIRHRFQGEMAGISVRELPGHLLLLRGDPC